MAERLTGTVTFLFSDIEQSTRLLDALGAAAYGTALTDHRRLMRTAFAAHNGHEVDTQGDAFFVAFQVAADAVEAARDAQVALAAHNWPDGEVLRVRIGIHTSDVTDTGEGYVGLGVHRGARICASGHGGQVLVSQTTRDLLRDHSVELRDLGEHRLKDFSEPQHLYQLMDPQLSTDFPPLRTHRARSLHLPAQTTPLVGREPELEAISALLADPSVRLVTLTGPPGAGKTRLALRAAELSTADGVYFVGLAPIVDPALVIPSIAQALGIDETSGQSLVAFLSDKQFVLLLDNFEQVIDAAPSVADLLADAPGVKVVATSRERLRIAAEQVYPVAPLPVDESVELFVLRAQAINPSFVLDDPAVVATICDRVDGLPLAIELAAARTVILEPVEILRRLDQRLSLLTSRSRDVPTRQQTLRDTLEWSYQLLAEEEQVSFSRLGVFRGGFDLRSAEAVCSVDLDVIASLVDKNLVRRDGDRFSMLETMREYALERLAANDDLDEVRDRHASYFLDLVELAYAGRMDSDEEWATRLERDHDNCRAAFEWLAESDPETAQQLTSALGWFWHTHSHMSEGRRRLEHALAGAITRDEIRARSLTALGTIAGWQGDIAAAQPPLEEAIVLWQRLGETAEEALALEALAWSYFWVGENEAGRAAGERSLLLQKQVGNERLINRARLTVCQIVVALGDVDTATALATESLAVATAQGDAWALHLAHHFLADCAVITRDYPTAHGRYQQALRAAMAIGNRTEASLEIQGVAMALAGLGQPERSIRLDAAASAELSRQGVDISGVEFWAKLRFDARTTAESQLDTLSATAAEQAGTSLRLEEAVADALG